MLLTAFILFIWFESDILVSLVKLLKLENKLYIKDYEHQRLEFAGKLSYVDFLHIKRSSLFTKLISCPICLCFWLTLAQCLINYSNILFVAYMFAFHYFINLVVYLIVKKLYDNK